MHKVEKKPVEEGKMTETDMIFKRDAYNEGSFLFDDGTFGHVADPEFDVSEFIDNEDFDWDILDSSDQDAIDKAVSKEFGGKLPIGNIYIDRWGLNGDFYQGGCFLYYEGETLIDYCHRNGEPLPVREIPDEIIDMFEAGDFDGLRALADAVPELKDI